MSTMSAKSTQKPEEPKCIALIALRFASFAHTHRHEGVRVGAQRVTWPSSRSHMATCPLLGQILTLFGTTT
jgi:hypothetical protein